MSISKTLLGTVRQVPERPEKGWGPQGTGILVSLIDVANMVGYSVGGVLGLLLPSASFTLAAAAVLTPTAPVAKVQGTPGAVTVTLAAGVNDGQILEIIGVHATNTVTILSAGTAALNGDITLGLYDSLILRWDTALGVWIERARNS